MIMTRELPQGFVVAKKSDLFFDRDGYPVIKFGIRYFTKISEGLYRGPQVTDMDSIGPLIHSDVKAGKVYVCPLDGNDEQYD